MQIKQMHNQKITWHILYKMDVVPRGIQNLPYIFHQITLTSWFLVGLLIAIQRRFQRIYITPLGL